MTQRVKLRERYFEQPLENDEKVREEIATRWLKQRDFLKSQYMPEFMTWLNNCLDAYEIKPGTHEEMLHNSGVRKGLLLVKQHIDVMRRNIEELINADRI